MTSSGDDRSIRADNVANSVLSTGDGTTNTLTTRVAPPTVGSVDLRSELVALREVLAGLSVPEQGRMDRALADASDEAAKAEPDKEELAGAVGRALKAARGANDFAEQVEKLTPLVTALASWAGPAGHALLSLLGLGT
jgi:hypothetical protein